MAPVHRLPRIRRIVDRPRPEDGPPLLAPSDIDDLLDTLTAADAEEEVVDIVVEDEAAPRPVDEDAPEPDDEAETAVRRPPLSGFIYTPKDDDADETEAEKKEEVA